MRRLPTHHLARPRLTSSIGEVAVTVVEAPGGYGKTSLAVEAAQAIGVRAAHATLTPADGADPELVVARIAHALRREGVAVPEPAEELDALVDALDAELEPLLVTVDEIGNLREPGQRALARLAAELPARHRLVLLGRTAGALARLPEAHLLGPAELALTADELAGLLRGGFGVTVGPSGVDALWRATSGWPAPVVLAGARLAAAGDVIAELDRLLGRRRFLRSVLADQLAALGPDDQRALAVVARLPFASEEVETALGVPGLVDRAMAAGLPFGADHEGRWELIGPVRDELAREGDPDRDALRRIGPAYVAMGEPLAAVQLLAGVGEHDDAAALLAGLGPDELHDASVAEVQALVAALPDAVVERHVGVLLQLARVAEPTYRADARSAALERARALLDAPGSDPRLSREVDAERARDLARDADVEGAERLARAVLDEAAPDELAARARALEALGRASAWWRRDRDALRRAAPLFEESIRLATAAGRPRWAADAHIALGYGVRLSEARFDEAVEQLGAALALLPYRSRERAVALVLRGDVLLDAGRLEEAQADVDEARAIAEALRDADLQIYADWNTARMVARRGDRDATIAAIHAAESRMTPAWRDGPNGLTFLADAADYLSAVGDVAGAFEYLDRARDQAPGERPPLVVEAIVEARSGDPREAQERIEAALADGEAEVRDRVRLLTLRAHAALRAGDAAAPALAARAFDEARRLGAPELPLLLEPAVAHGLLALAAEGGSASAAALLDRRLPVSIRLLGGFAVTRGGAAVDLPPGRPAQLVKVVAARGGRVGVEEAIELLWPEVDPASGRKRMRNVLNRLRAAGELVAREGSELVLTGADVDAAAFETEARQALSAFAAGDAARAGVLARAALSRYRGPLLPGDAYEDWASEARHRLARLYVALLDGEARRAEAAGDSPEAVRLLELAIAAEPLEEELYVRTIELLLASGRRLAAADVADRCRKVFSELGLEPPVLREGLSLSR